MILLVGLTTDTPLAAVAEAAARIGAQSLVVDQLRPRGVRVDADGVQRPDGTRIRPAELTGIYPRPHPLSGHGPDSAAGEALGAGVTDLAEEAPPEVRVVNRPAAARSNASKPAQSLAIVDAGFDVPETLVTTSPETAAAFRARNGRVIVKSTSGRRSIVRMLSPDESLEAVRACPTMFQEYVPGVEVRVHVVGGRVFAHRIVSDDVDYRYGKAMIVPVDLADEIAERCVRLTASLELLVAGIDLRFADDGRLICFEANTSPAFSCFDHDEAIADAIAALLDGRAA